MSEIVVSESCYFTLSLLMHIHIETTSLLTYYNEPGAFLHDRHQA